MSSSEIPSSTISLDEQQSIERDGLIALEIASSGLHRMLLATMEAWHEAQLTDPNGRATSAPVMDALHDRFWSEDMPPLPNRPQGS
jgi:hypothetical protein